MSSVFTRRRILYLLSGVALLAGFERRGLSCAGRKGGNFFQTGTDSEIRFARQCWERMNLGSPAEYLSSMNLGGPDALDGISSQIKKDFEIRNTINVRGLILSKTEVACLLVYVS